MMDETEEIRELRALEPPVSVYWLGEGSTADMTRHAQDVTGCVLYFESEAKCLAFMEWLGRL